MTTESTTLEHDSVLTETVGATRIVTLNRPQARNALTLPMIGRAQRALDDAAMDPAIRCLVVAGSGGHFCAGADLRAAFPDRPSLLDRLEHYLDTFHGLVRSLVRCEKPTIAMMEGAAVGFGADLAYGCDFRVAATSAYAQEKFVDIGLMPDGGGTFWLPRLVGTARAMQMMLLAEKISAHELHRLGIVTEVAQPPSLRNATLALAQRLEKGPPLAFSAIKRAVLESAGLFEDALRREREGQLRLLRSADAAEGITAWLEKRSPRFEGR